ncbi:MAG: NTP transferase domain-containing protein [Oscillospiraceae bacterium]|nr:NTP transferase domain-containing protein [Oscillospiraceae bacterium]
MKSQYFVPICRELINNPKATQRELASGGGISLGIVNATINQCKTEGLLESADAQGLFLTKKGLAELEKYRVRNAIILAAGFGSRCVPMTYETPKGLLSVYGEPMIERQIKQLHEKGITEIIIVVGYKKEHFDYLIDKYGVKLVFNPEYTTKNNLSSVYRVLPWLESSYLLMSDFWIENNIFNTYESRSWYSCQYFDVATAEWCVEVTASDKIASLAIGGSDAWAIVGPAYFSASFSAVFSEYVKEYYARPGTEDFYWEHILRDKIESLPMYINRQSGNVHEFENLDELRIFDPSYDKNAQSGIMRSISKVFDVSQSKIQNVKPIKKGMTNDSFLFSIGEKNYVYRVPGAGTDKLINRENEYSVYQIVSRLGLCEDIIYINPKNGHKIAAFFDNCRVCDPQDAKDVRMCMKKLREFHTSKLRVEHTFDIFGQIEFYEKLFGGSSCYRDYADTKAGIMELREYIDAQEKDWVLSHIDAVPDNFLFIGDGSGDFSEIRMIDWEYAGMQDPHVDIAMFAVYAMYDRKHVEALIDSYFDGGSCPPETRLKIYAYIASCGFLWSNWCEFKRTKGVEYGEYAMLQYRFAKDYYKVFNENKNRK